MRNQQVFRSSAIAAAVVAMTLAGCDRAQNPNSGMSTDVNLSDDAAANDVLGGNEAATNEAAASEAASL